MRFLFTAPAAAGHLFPMVSTAHALRAAGHEVLFAGSAPLEFFRNTGIPVVDVGDGTTTNDHFRKIHKEVAGAGFVAKGRSDEDTFALAARGFGSYGRTMLPGLLRLGRAWRPDVLFHGSYQAVGPLVAAQLGIPAVLHNFGAMPGRPMLERMGAEYADEYQQRGLSPAESAVMDVVPVSLGGDGGGWRARYVPYNGGGIVPFELLGGRGGRRRVAVTLGTVVTAWDGVRAITGLVRQAAEVDAEFLLAVGGADLSVLGELPANVRALPWVPLSQLVDSVDAIVHHAGDGTSWTAAAAGLPQLMLPQGANQFVNARLAAERGFGLVAAAEEVDSALLERLLTDDGLRTAAAALRAEIDELPAPAELVPELEKFARG